jgi:threonine aldolase
LIGRLLPPINLYSDTQTKPTGRMREAIAHAEVGDEQRGLDPTTNALQERVAELLGHEAAMFLPSGTMCNEIALRIHVRPGSDEHERGGRAGRRCARVCGWVRYRLD